MTDYYFPGNGTGVIITARPVVARNGVWTGDWQDRITYQSISDGGSNTFLAGEMHFESDKLNMTPYNGPMFNGSELPAHSRVGGPGVPILSPSQEPADVYGFGSAHPGVCNFVRSDGSTSSMAVSLDTVVLANLCNRADGNTDVGQ